MKKCGYKYEKSVLLESKKDKFLKIRIPEVYLAIAGEIGEGNVSIGVRKAIVAEAERRGIIHGAKREALLIFYATAFGGAEVLVALEHSPLSLSDIAERTGMKEEDVEVCLRLLERRGLIAEDMGRYRQTDEGRYMVAILDTMDRDLEVLRSGKGLEAITALHTRLAERLVGRKGDIKDAVDRMSKTAELMKRNTEALFRIIS